MSAGELQASLEMDLAESGQASGSPVASRPDSSLRRLPAGPKVPAAREDGERAIEAPLLPPQEVESTRLSGVTAAVLDPRSVASEHFRILATRLQMRLPSDRAACIGVVSAAAGEGKTTVSIGLAHALSRTVGARVALLDLDLRRPAVARELGLGKAEGVGEWLDNRREGIRLRLPSEGSFVVATTGELTSRRFELLGAPPMVNALESARRAFDFTVLDLPPLMPVADAVILQDHIDGLVLVVRSRRCPTETIRAAVSRLREGTLLGVVLNDQRDIIPSYYSYAGRRYGKC